MMDSLSKTGEVFNTDQCNYQISSSNYIESLPVDVIFEILVRVPAQDVCNSTRLVCRKWYKITNTRDFKNAHLQRSTFGLLAQDRPLRERHELNFIATGSKSDDPIEISKQSYRPEHKVLSSCCNGLVLEARDDYRYFYITNPITKQNLVLPPFSSKNGIAHYASAIAYVATTMEYKVVRGFSQYDFKPRNYCVAILTAGVDEDWMPRVNTQHLSLPAKKLLRKACPFTTQGFVHWARDDDMITWARPEKKYGHVLTLNVETEIISQFPLPSLRSQVIGLNTEVIYLPMGSYLSLLKLRSKFSWELWEMNPENGDWTELPSIDLEDTLILRNYLLEPVGWLRPREVLFFSVTEIYEVPDYSPPVCFAFTVCTRKLQKFTLDGFEHRYLVHRNSLVWINGC